MISENREKDALRQIQASFQKRGRAPSMRELMHELGYKSPRSASKLVDALTRQGFIERKTDGKIRLRLTPEHQSESHLTVPIPLVGNAACGLPMLAEENQEALIPVSTQLAKPPYRYFLLRAKGDSMNNAGIEDGNLVLVKQQNDAQNGDIVVALIDQEATIKQYQRHEQVVLLKPQSRNEKHQPIIVTSDLYIQGKVVGTIPGWNI